MARAGTYTSMNEEEEKAVEQILKHTNIRLHTIGDEGGECGDKVAAAIVMALNWWKKGGNDDHED